MGSAIHCDSCTTPDENGRLSAIGYFHVRQGSRILYSSTPPSPPRKRGDNALVPPACGGARGGKYTKSVK